MITSRSSAQGSRRAPWRLTKQWQALYWYGGNRNLSCTHLSLSPTVHCCRPAGLYPGASLGRDVVKVGRGSAEFFRQPGSRKCSCFTLASSRTVRSPWLFLSMVEPSPPISSQSTQYSLGLRASETPFESISHGLSPKSSDIMRWSALSIDPTDSIKVRTWAQGNDCLTNDRTRETWTNRLLLASRKAPFLAAFKPLTPWQGGPAPISTNAAWLNFKAQEVTISSLISVTSCTLIVLGNRDSTTRAAASSFSTAMWPMTFQPRASTAARRAPIPSNKPIVTTCITSAGSTKSPLTGHWAATQPAGVTRVLAVTPPPLFDASLAVTMGETLLLKSIKARGINPKNLANSVFTSLGIGRRIIGG